MKLLESLSREEVERFGQKIPTVHFERGRHVYTPAYRGEVLFLILRGRVRTYKVVKGQEITLAVVRAGEVLGEAAFTSRRRPGAYAEAIEPSEVALVSLATFGRLVREKPEVGLKAMELLGERLSFYEGKMADMSLKEVPARLASLLVDLIESEGVAAGEGYTIPARYTHEQLGAMIGAKRVAVTRALGELRRARVVESAGRRLYVKNMEALIRAAGS